MEYWGFFLLFFWFASFGVYTQKGEILGKRDRWDCHNTVQIIEGHLEDCVSLE